MQKVYAVLLIVLCAAFVTSQANPSPFKEPTEALFKSAWLHHSLFKELQITIDEKVYEIQTAASAVLRVSTNKTLTQVENNAVQFLEYDDAVRVVLNPLLPDGCISDLMEILEGVTHMAGFDSSNCLRHYDISLQNEFANFTKTLETFGNLSVEIQQIVVRSFIGKNAFKVPLEIEERFVKAWNSINYLWTTNNPILTSIISNLVKNIDGFNNQLGQCFNSLQIEYDESYTKVNDKRLVCQEFARSARAFMSGNRFNIADFLPTSK